jgi:fructose 1,6-bisphosphatase
VSLTNDPQLERSPTCQLCLVVYVLRWLYGILQLILNKAFSGNLKSFLPHQADHRVLQRMIAAIQTTFSDQKRTEQLAFSEKWTWFKR